ncbi:MAG: ester cyclase [Dehalococcoidia bacterium]
MIEELLKHLGAEAERSINGRDWEAYGRLFAESVVMQTPFPGPRRGRDSRVKMVQGIIEAFPDGRVEAKRSFGQGDWGCMELMFTGTHGGPLLGPGGKTIPATNKPVRFPYCIVVKFENGEITELNEYFDQVEILSQLGLME